MTDARLPIPEAMRASITGVQQQSGLEGADRVELSLTNEGFRWSDHKLLKLDTKLTLDIGYAPDQLQHVFTGEIVSQSASFPSNGLPTLTIAAQDRRHRQQEGSRVRSFGIPIPTYGTVPLAPDTEVARLVASEDALAADFEPIGAIISYVLAGVEALGAFGDPIELQKLVRKQEGESNYAFLSRLARENGWEMFIDHTQAANGLLLRFFSSIADGRQADVKLTYGKSLIDFNPRISNVGQIASVTAFVWIARIKTRLAITIGWDWDHAQFIFGVGFGAVPGGKGPSSVLIQEPIALASVPRKIIKTLIPKLNKYLTGTGSTVGDPHIQAGKVLKLDGLAPRFNGLYRVTSATHTIDSSGYRTSFEVHRELRDLPLPAGADTPFKFQGTFGGVS
jgi:uncharacterized protein